MKKIFDKFSVQIVMFFLKKLPKEKEYEKLIRFILEAKITY
jgi:hypothetical protein